MVQIRPIKYMGADSLQTSTANQELVPEIPNTDGIKHTFTSFSFYNHEEVQIKINGGEPIYLGKQRGFQTTSMNTQINSFIVVTAGVPFEWIGEY